MLHNTLSLLRCPTPLLSVCLASAYAVVGALPLSAEGSSKNDVPAPEDEIVVESAPSFRQVLDLTSVGSVAVSPDGSAVAYTLRTTDWQDNSYDTEIWVARRQAGTFGAPVQFTRTDDGSSTSPEFSPDGEWLGFLATRKPEEDAEGAKGKSQVFRMAVRGGEAQRLTQAEEGVESFRWAPDSSSVAYLSRDPEDEDSKKRKVAYGEFRIEDERMRFTHLWVQDNDPEAQARRLTSGREWSVDDLEFSPDGSLVAITHRPKPQIDSFPQADVSLVEVATGELRPLVSQAGGDSMGVWSPDGSSLLITSPMGANDYYGNTEIAQVDIELGEIRSLTSSFDESAFPVAWHADRGVLFVASQRTQRSLFNLDPGPRAIEKLPLTGDILSRAALSRDGTTLAWVAEGADSLAEVFVAPTSNLESAQKITDQTSQTAGWPLGTREVTTWTSRDGTEIEGVLLLPENHDRGAPAPLMVVIHGGPTGTSRPELIAGYVYPIEQWLAKGAIVMMPNYRGSAGYGADFRALNVRNLGVGDAWDVESGVDALIERGLVDESKVAAMGWSQGGYISAFLATTSDKFQAISNGAGISNWMTYYVNTDIHGFTRQYLEATPWDDPEVYAKTSPMTYIKGAKTPTLIQHGEFDARVPPPNAFELYQGLQDQDVPTRLVIYSGFGHGITKPKERLAAVWHNWQWFEKWLWGNEVELPLPTSEQDSEEGSGSQDQR